MKLSRTIPMLLLAGLLAACKEPLYSHLSEKEANDIVGALLAQDIAAEKTPGEEKTWTVMIAHDDFARAVAVLKAADYPHEPASGLGDVFKKQGLVSSPVEERARLTYALSEEMAATLSRIDGVIVARVHVALAPPDPLTGQQRPSSVSVFIKHRPDADLQRLVPRIKTLVVNGIEGATYDNVSIGLFPVDGTAPLPASRTPAPIVAPGDAVPWPQLALGAAAGLLAVALALGSRAWLRGRQPAGSASKAA